MFCSTIIPTIGRDLLDRAVTSVLEQDFEREPFELIVVNDTGRPLPHKAWHDDPRVTILTTNKRERCVARNTGAAIAKGRYLHFLDDDDWMLQGAFEAIWQLAQQKPAAHWLYGSAQLVDRQNKPIIELHHGINGNGFVHTMAGEWMPLQTGFIRRDAFFNVGGFHPMVLATQDVDLCRRISLQGDLAEVRQLIAGIGMGQENSSTDYANAAQYSRWAREQILNKPDVFPRLLDSAVDGFWQGRIVRAYATSVVWNVQHKQYLRALSRATFAGLAMVLAVGNGRLFTRSFWQALTKRYISPSFLQGFQQSGNAELLQKV